MTYQSKGTQTPYIGLPHTFTVGSIGQLPLLRRPTNTRWSNQSMAQGKDWEGENGTYSSSHVRSNNPFRQYAYCSPPPTATRSVLPSDSSAPPCQFHRVGRASSPNSGLGAVRIQSNSPRVNSFSPSRRTTSILKSPRPSFALPSSLVAELRPSTQSPHVLYEDPEEYEYTKEDDDLHSQSGNSISSGSETRRSSRRSSCLSPIPYGDEDEYEESEGQERTLCQIVQSPIGESKSSSVSFDHLNMSDEIPNLVAVTTQIEYERYERGYTRPTTYSENYTIPPRTTAFGPPSLDKRPGWKTFVHPEGTRYFYCDSIDNPVPVLTEAWIYEDEVFKELTLYMNAIFAFMKKHKVSFPRPAQPSQNRANHRKSTQKRCTGDHWEEGEHIETPQDLAPVVLVLEFRLSGRVGYYFVDHPSQTLFWLEPFDFTYMLMEVRVDWTEWLVGLQMKSHYWLHNELFPHLYELVDDDIDEIDDIVGYATGDLLTATRSTVNWDPDMLKYLQTMLHRYQQKDLKRRRRSVGERRTICRILVSFYDERFLNLYGDKAARLSVSQSIHYSEHRRRRFRDIPPAPADNATQVEPWYRRIAKAVMPWMWQQRSASDDDPNYEDASPPVDVEARNMQRNSVLLNIFSLIMFGGPGIHMKRLRELTVDRIVRKHGFEKYVEKMVEEWRDITLYATVILSANVSFLTIQSVDEAGSAGHNRTNSQRASYFSILASMGTIVFSLLLLRQHRENISYKFVANRTASRWGLESLAIMYGVPFSLLVWSMVSFFTSFAILWFRGQDNVVISVVSISCFIFAVILAWGAAAAYETKQYESYAGKVVKKTGEVGKKVGEKVRSGTVDIMRSARRMSTGMLSTSLTRKGGGGDAVIDMQVPVQSEKVTVQPESGSIPGIRRWLKRPLFGRKRSNAESILTPQL